MPRFSFIFIFPWVESAMLCMGAVAAGAIVRAVSVVAGAAAGGTVWAQPTRIGRAPAAVNKI
ncbi:MAG: hypothetical protein WKG07_09195 [Hymenobacter sp.]